MTHLGENLYFALGQDEVDKLNSEFYGKIKYPWAPAAFQRIRSNTLWHKMLSQDIGYWQHDIIPNRPQIWVAGCGTNQALFTALKFPYAHVLGSDLSQNSIEVCYNNAKKLNVVNLELKRESINHVQYENQFDYIISTGVIHHNSDPLVPLQKISAALRNDGILELMVYNKFHRISTSAFQLAIRELAKCTDKPNLEKELPLAKLVVNNFKGNNLIARLLRAMESASDAAFADMLLQPVEHSYTIDSLVQLSSKCNLELLHFCLDQFSIASGNNLDWNLKCEDQFLQKIYDELEDIKRWHITNLLLGEESPMLWFYIHKKDSNRLRKSEQQICKEFLLTKFKRVNLTQEMYILKEDNTYSTTPITLPFPIRKKNWPYKEAQAIYENLDENLPIGKTFDKCGISHSFSMVNKLRLCLTTSAYPYLQAYS